MDERLKKAPFKLSQNQAMTIVSEEFKGVKEINYLGMYRFPQFLMERDGVGQAAFNYHAMTLKTQTGTESGTTHVILWDKKGKPKLRTIMTNDFLAETLRISTKITT